MGLLRPIQENVKWGREKRLEILKYMERPDVVPLPLLCAEACGVSRKFAREWLEQGLAGHPEYEYFARTACQIRAQYAQRLLAELLDAKVKTPAQKARQFMLERLSAEDFQPPAPIKQYAPAALPAPEEPIEATVELLSLPQPKDGT